VETKKKDVVLNLWQTVDATLHLLGTYEKRTIETGDLNAKGVVRRLFQPGGEKKKRGTRGLLYHIILGRKLGKRKRGFPGWGGGVGGFFGGGGGGRGGVG